MNIDRATDLIVANLERMGLIVYRGFSGSSNSQYLTVGIWKNYGGDNEEWTECSIRISDHALPPSYHILNGTADYDVSTGDVHDDCHTINWFDAIFFAAKKFNLKPTPAAKGAKTKAENAAALAEKKRQEIELAWQAASDKRAKDRADYLSSAKSLGSRAAQLSEWLEKTDRKLADMPGGKSRRNLKNKARIKQRELRSLLETQQQTVNLV